MQGKVTQYSFSFDSQRHQNFASVLVSTLATHVPGQAGSPIRRCCDAGSEAVWPAPECSVEDWGEALQGQHELMLMRIESRGPNRLLAEVREQSNLMTQFRE